MEPSYFDLDAKDFAVVGDLFVESLVGVIEEVRGHHIIDEQRQLFVVRVHILSG